MNSTLIDDSTTSAAIQEARLDNIPDPIAQASGISTTSQNMASAKKKLEEAVKDLTISVDNQNILFKSAQAELSEIDQKVGALQSRVAMAKVNNGL